MSILTYRSEVHTVPSHSTVTKEEPMPVQEAQTDETPYGRYVTSEGWFVHNLEDALAVQFERGGALYPLEPREAPFRDLGVNVRVLQPGVVSALYHAEDLDEGFLVLGGECLLVVEEEERPLRRWDYFHCPAGTRHVIVGAGDGPCVVLMIGARRDGTSGVSYPVSPVAAKHGASVASDTDSPEEAYADWPEDFEPVRLPWPAT
jgi:uncharacterized cupin superfamily protein